ncbi:indolepyruvate ferredoxin oxidoreductase [Dongia mobilis]|uniref:Indolepyruvate ferredoxin oxidoreductase n=1 Tax=Dongia mobilis TaxID=578943 RepID=A0A4R6WWW3_9PROT|nr:indolepyruvate ferredoxin oxidoreductase family protein [Dongia mobilis]TDQ84544.1 indolepyruvate ferredoxin oxidoreductase [Dongia mobilis]
MPKLAAVSLDDKYDLGASRVYLTGTQALARLPLMQRQRDERAGLNTAGYVTGYRGSPLGSIDFAFTQAKAFLARQHIHFQPGVNEDIAATAVWGTQQTNLFGDGKYDGVFAMWYAKGPGVDRSGDALRHGNLAGSARHGGVLLLAGDDHTCKSSTTAHQSEFALVDSCIPILNPSNVQEIFDFGLLGWAMSRYSGCWVAMKLVSETAETAASVDIDPARLDFVVPTDYAMPTEGLNIRLPASPMAQAQALEQELRLHRDKLAAATAFARANKVDRVVLDSPGRRLGIVTCGKSYADVRQALEDLGIDERRAAEFGISLLKIGFVWPMDPGIIRDFARGLDEILVVEEKRALLEPQIKEHLYALPERPRVIGKHDEASNWILPSAGDLSPGRIALVIGARLRQFVTDPPLDQAIARIEAIERAASEAPPPPTKRIAYFCSGCPHNTSTRVPEGSRALAGIGCHFMAQWMDRETATYTQMGGEGGTWIGAAPFSTRPHIFQNMGDGTYYHSGLLAIRAACAAETTMTFKLLYNDAVALTGGQPMDGPLTVPAMARQVAAEGVRRIAIVSDEPEKFAGESNLPAGTSIHHRDALDEVQRELREVAGVSVLIYDQTCAAEKRRRRKRGLMEDPPKRAFINTAVCEGCGDCGRTSNCVSVAPLETAMGRKRQIDQSSCNKDFSCVEGFCPSFVTVHGGRLRKPRVATMDAADLPDPALPELTRPYNILVTGIGGTGIVTIGAILGMAAHLEGKHCSVMDLAGLAQKGGAVFSHVRIAAAEGQLHATRIATGAADLLLGCDIVVSASNDALATLQAGHSRAVVNTHEVATGAFTRDPDWDFPATRLQRDLQSAIGKGGIDFIDATGIAAALLGDSIATNLFVLGHAYQRGLVPVSAAAIERAIELNGVAVDFNRQAFAWGRNSVHDPAGVAAAAAPTSASEPTPQTLDEIVRHRAAHLAAYQDTALAERYRTLVARVAAVERKLAPESEALARAVALGYAKLLAYKDEYEVARLFTDGSFATAIAAQFEGDFKLRYHLAPPLIARPGADGHPRKMAFGGSALWAFRLLARLKGLRGTPFDIFGRTEERRTERRLITDYEADISAIIDGLTVASYDTAVALAQLPLDIRGFGHVKAAAIALAHEKRRKLTAQFAAQSLADAPRHHAAK